jgi:hypothetical protein
MTLLNKLLFLMVISGSLLYGQDRSELSGRIVSIKKLAESSEMDLKLTAIDELGDLLAEASEGADKEGALGILSFLASEGVTNVTYEGLTPGATSSEVRAEAALLLGEYGGEKEASTLVNMMFYDNDPYSISAAVTASSRLTGVENENIVNAYSRILMNTRSVYLDEALIQTVLIAISVLAEKNPDIFNHQELQSGLDMTSLGYSGYSRKTRNMAIELIRTAELSGRSDN